MKNFLKFLAVLTFVIGSFCLFKGFDKKYNYQNPEYAWQESTNAYVGGDAYNYIINSNYFTGYNVLSIGCYVITVICLSAVAILNILEKNAEQSKKYYEFIYDHPLFCDSEKQIQIEKRPTSQLSFDKDINNLNSNNLPNYPYYGQQMQMNQWKQQIKTVPNSQQPFANNSSQFSSYPILQNENNKEKQDGSESNNIV